MGSIGASNGVGTGGTLGAKHTISNAEEYRQYSEYAGELAQVVQDFNTPVYEINYNGGKAFADTNYDYAGELHIGFIASTGNGAGTELLSRLAEKAKQENLALTWAADTPSAQKFYTHLGLNEYISGLSASYVNYYEVPVSKLDEFIAKLRRKG